MSAKDSFGSDASNYDHLNMIPQRAEAIEDLDKIKSDIKTTSTLPDSQLKQNQYEALDKKENEDQAEQVNLIETKNDNVVLPTETVSKIQTNSLKVDEPKKLDDSLAHCRNGKISSKEPTYENSKNFIKKDEFFKRAAQIVPSKTNFINEHKSEFEINNRTIIVSCPLIMTDRTGNIIKAVYRNPLTLESICHYYFALNVDNPNLYREVKYFYYPLIPDPYRFRYRYYY
jgi:hypothetical protein